MSAIVTRLSGYRNWDAWCETCQDGVRRASIKTAQRWADKHNTTRHPKEADDDQPHA